jgi:predicted chitinase
MIKLPDAFNTNWPLIKKELDSNDINILSAAAGTVQVECSSWEPVFEKRADPVRQKALYDMQEKYWKGGFYGRGFIQLTGKQNYLDAATELGLNLYRNPNLALKPDVASKIFAWFFKRSGAQHHAWSGDLVGARRCINGPGLLGLEEFEEYVAYFKHLLAGGGDGL